MTQQLHVEPMDEDVDLMQSMDGDGAASNWYFCR